METVVIQLLDEIKKLNHERIEEIKRKNNNTISYRSDETKDIFAALAKAQAEMDVASLNMQNPYFKTRYADMAEIVKASRPALTKYGLCVLQQLITHDDGANILVTTLAHSSGQFVESRMRIMPPKNDIQSLGSYISYLRRYSYAALTGIVTSGEDDDGESAVAVHREAVRTAAPIKSAAPRVQSTLYKS